MKLQSSVLRLLRVQQAAPPTPHPHPAIVSLSDGCAGSRLPHGRLAVLGDEARAPASQALGLSGTGRLSWGPRPCLGPKSRDGHTSRPWPVALCI